MRRYVTFLFTLILGITLLAPLVSAVSPDPNRVAPWEYKARPDTGGDDGGWEDIDALPSP